MINEQIEGKKRGGGLGYMYKYREREEGRGEMERLQKGRKLGRLGEED